MRIIPVEPYPLRQAYDSFEAAIEGANNHPLQKKAQSDTTKLAGATLIDAYWTDTDFVIQFSNNLLLHISAAGDETKWEVLSVPPRLSENKVERVGAAPVTLLWPSSFVMDRSALVAKRQGSVCKLLFVNEFGLWVYCQGQLILTFSAIRRTDFDQSILFVNEDD